MPYADPRDPRALEARRRHYRANRAQYAENRRRQRERSQAFVTEQKAQPCTDCGGTFPPVAMDFDHLGNDKTGHLSRMARDGCSIKTLRAEIAKCSLVCANCHRVRTATRRGRSESN